MVDGCRLLLHTPCCTSIKLTSILCRILVLCLRVVPSHLVPLFAYASKRPWGLCLPRDVLQGREDTFHCTRTSRHLLLYQNVLLLYQNVHLLYQNVPTLFLVPERPFTVPERPFTVPEHPDALDMHCRRGRELEALRTGCCCLQLLLCSRGVCTRV